MPQRQTTPLKGSALLPEENNVGAHYYAFSPARSISTYTKASATIILPPVQANGNPGVKNVPNANAGAQYERRNAFISLGIGTEEMGWGVDLGLINLGTGWHPVYYDTAGEKSERFPTYTAPSNAAKAAIAVLPISNTQVKLYIQFMNASGGFVGTKFEQIINVKAREKAWAKYYRFASLVQDPQKLPDILTDSTYMINGQFTDLKLFKSNGTTEDWGIQTSNIQDAWIMSHPKCQVLTQGNTFESFSIDHWA